MKFERLESLIGEEDKQVLAIVNSVKLDILEFPYIVSETVRLLDDDCVLNKQISDYNMKALARLLKMYSMDCWDIFMVGDNLSSLLKSGRVEIYYVEAARGTRRATEGEIEQGVKELTMEYAYPAGEKEYKMLNLLNWTFTGKNRYFVDAGYKLNYSKDGSVLQTSYQLIEMAANDIMDMFKWISVHDNYEGAIKKIKKFKNGKKYRHASYAEDEIEADINIKQLLHTMDKSMPRGSSVPEYRKAISLVIKSKRYKLEPIEISFLRKVYDIYTKDVAQRAEMDKADNAVRQKLKEDCEYLLSQRYSGKISDQHFAYKIIETLKKSDYKKCSAKQKMILDDALMILMGEKKQRAKHQDEDGESSMVTSGDNSDVGGNVVCDILSDDSIDEAMKNIVASKIDSQIHMVQGMMDIDLGNISDSLGSGKFSSELI